MAFYVSDTDTPGKIYEISVEHHKDVEVRLENVQKLVILRPSAGGRQGE